MSVIHETLPPRLPLRVDPRLWEAFAEDRIKYPRAEETVDQSEVIPCPDCETPTRNKGVPAADLPGTVLRVTVAGLCTACWRRRATGRLRKQGRPRDPRSLEVMTCPCCKTPTRSRWMDSAEHPDTSERVNNTGLCRYCHRKGRTA